MTALPANLRVVSTLPPDHDGYSVLDAEALQALRDAEERHFWFQARNETIARRLRRLSILPPARVLELGCGAGCVAAHLARAGYDVSAVEGHLSLARTAAQRAPRARVIVHDLARGTADLGLGTFDAVGLFDVIEHLDDPAAALGQALALVRPGGWVVGTVPALMRLWTELDRVSGHRRRFERDELERLLRGISSDGGVEVAPFNRVLVPLLFLQRRGLARAPDRAAVNSFAIPSPIVNAALLQIVRGEERASALLDRTALRGASLWFALRRPPEGPR